MTIAPSELERAALDMEPEIRARLAAVLIESLEELGDVNRAEIEEQWVSEAEDRCRQIDRGEVELESAEDALEALRRRHR